MKIRIAPYLLEAVGFFVSALLLSACGQRELCYDHTHWLDLRVEFDWSEAPDADPRTMVVYLFALDRKEAPLRYEVSEYKGIDIRVPAGQYHAVTFNGDTETLKEIGDSYDNFVISTDEQDLLAPMMRTNLTNAPRPPGTETQTVKVAPDKMWSGKLENLNIMPGVKGQYIRFTPKLSTTSVSIKLTNVIHMNYDLDMSGALSSIAESYQIGEQHHTGKDVTIPMALEILDDTTIMGTASIFGHCDVSKGSLEKKHLFTIYTSNKYYYTYDVTNQIHESTDLDNIEIVIDGFNLVESGSGLTPNVENWDNVVYKDIDM